MFELLRACTSCIWLCAPVCACAQACTRNTCLVVVVPMYQMQGLVTLSGQGWLCAFVAVPTVSHVLFTCQVESRCFTCVPTLLFCLHQLCFCPALHPPRPYFCRVCMSFVSLAFCVLLPWPVCALPRNALRMLVLLVPVLVLFCPCARVFCPFLSVCASPCFPCGCCPCPVRFRIRCVCKTLRHSGFPGDPSTQY